MSARRGMVTALVLLTLALTLGACTGSAPAAQPPSSTPGGQTSPNVRLRIATATTGGSFYPAGIAAAQLYSEKVKGVQASAITSAGSVENISLLANKEADIVCMQSDVLAYVYAGEEQFKDKANSDLRILVPILDQHYNITVTKQSGIKSLADFKGKRIMVGRAGSGTVVTHEKVMAPFGITLKDVDPNYLGQNEGMDALRNGKGDAMISPGFPPVAMISDALATPGTNISLLSLSADEIAKLTKANPWMVPVSIAGDTYPGVKQEINTVGHLGFFVVNKDFSEDLAYQMVKSMYQNKEWLIESFAGFKSSCFLEPSKALTISVPLHAGSEKALKELGLIK